MNKIQKVTLIVGLIGLLSGLTTNASFYTRLLKPLTGLASLGFVRMAAYVPDFLAGDGAEPKVRHSQDRHLCEKSPMIRTQDPYAKGSESTLATEPEKSISSVTLTHKFYYNGTVWDSRTPNKEHFLMLGMLSNKDYNPRDGRLSSCNTTIDNLIKLNLPQYVYMQRRFSNLWDSRSITGEGSFVIGNLHMKANGNMLKTNFVPYTSKLVEKRDKDGHTFTCYEDVLGRTSLQSDLIVHDVAPQKKGNMYRAPSLVYRLSEPASNGNSQKVFSHVMRPVESEDGNTVELAATINETSTDNSQNHLHVHITYPTNKKCKADFIKDYGSDKLDTFAQYMQKCTTIPLQKLISPKAKTTWSEIEAYDKADSHR